MTAAAAPDVVGEMEDIIGRLRNMPRPWLDSREDIINNVQRESGRLLVLVKRVEIIEPIAAKKGAAPKLARIAARRARPQRGPENQMSLAL